MKAWITCNRDPQDLFIENNLSLLDKIGKKKEDKLKAAGVRTVGDLKNMLHKKLNEVQGIGGKQFTFLWNESQLVKMECAPAVTDHHKASNPYNYLYTAKLDATSEALPFFFQLRFNYGLHQLYYEGIFIDNEKNKARRQLGVLS